MKPKFIILVFNLLYGCFVVSAGTANAAVGTHKCGPYDLRDTRPQPPETALTEVFLDVNGNGYTLKVTFNDERGKREIPLTSKLHLDWSGRSYTAEPMKIAPDGRFSITILGKSNVCTYSGVAKISPEASYRLFKGQNISNSQITAVPSTQKKEYGSIEGNIEYPSEVNPRMTICAQSTSNYYLMQCIPTSYDQRTFKFTVNPGEYFVFGYVKNALRNRGIVYDAFLYYANRGKNNSPIPVKLNSNEVVRGVILRNFEICEFKGSVPTPNYCIQPPNIK